MFVQAHELMVIWYQKYSSFALPCYFIITYCKNKRHICHIIFHHIHCYEGDALSCYIEFSSPFLQVKRQTFKGSKNK
ncbi:hypothetical protein XELAEV_18007884mg [Xenopus laevis]|uniref:Uncharacterized protein n=1 Tax=Xenopus laevis TaxID=8355 RepID=A0A974I5T5_XENLA|nr:hypothetical protein XELAEV_18007884mg [Xenopus laevis]